MRPALLLAFGTLLGTTPAVAQRDACRGMQGHITNSDGRRTTVIVSERSGRCLEVRMIGQATFTDDDADVRSLETDGSLVATEWNGGTTRSLSLVERDGRIERTFQFDGASRPATESATWFRDIVLELVRSTTVGGEARVARIRARGGVSAVLDEVPMLRSSYVRRFYLERLLASGGISDGDVRRIADVARVGLESDHDKQVVLSAIATERGGDREVADAVIRGAATMGSDHGRAQVLLALLERVAADDELVARAIDAARDMGSDHERSTVLLAALDRSVPSAPVIRTSFFRTVDAIGSDHERGRVLAAASAPESLGADGVRAVLASAARIGSDHEKATVLLAVLERAERLRDPATRAAFDAALRTLGSDHEYRRVTQALAR